MKQIHLAGGKPRGVQQRRVVERHDVGEQRLGHDPGQPTLGVGQQRLLGDGVMLDRRARGEARPLAPQIQAASP